MSKPKNNGFIINSDGTVIDAITGLMWQQATAGPMTYEEAISYCNNLRLGGYDDWQLPTDAELISLRDSGKSKPAIDTTAFPDTKSFCYWSSTTDDGYVYGAQCVDFGNGEVRYYYTFNSLYVCSVRNGQRESYSGQGKIL